MMAVVLAYFGGRTTEKASSIIKKESNAKKIAVNIYKSKSRKRKGIHAKSKSSKVKSSKNYLKRYKGQGK